MSGEDSGDSVKDSVLKKIEIDAESDGFVFFREQVIPEVCVNYLYENPDSGYFRLYNGINGERITEYLSCSRRKGARKFHSPEETFKFSRGISNTWRGKGTKPL